MKMWSGRFKDATDSAADAFNSSLGFDKRLYKHDIKGSVAHCTMLGECGIIAKSEAEAIIACLNAICDDITSEKLEIQNAEDIHMFVEEELTKRIGTIGKKLHTARSRNDQVALDIRLYLRDTVDEINLLLKELILTLCEMAEENLETIIPAYTHMQKAQPTTLAHHFIAYCEMFLRDCDRLRDCRARINVMPLGSSALTGTTYPINRARVAELLGFDDVTKNSMDGVSDRDFAVEFLSACALIMTHLSRFNEEIIYWASDEFGYISLDDRFSTGSSIMPQKKNPDMSELIRGKTGRCYGNLISLLTTMKGLPLAYNKDMQEDKEILFDTEDTVKSCLSIFTTMLPTLKYNKEKLYAGASGGYTVATDCADYLAKKGMPFRQAHEVIGSLVLYCTENDKKLDELSVEEYKKFSELFETDILTAVKLENVIKNRNLVGGPAPKTVLAEIKNIRKILAKKFPQE